MQFRHYLSNFQKQKIPSNINWFFFLKISLLWFLIIRVTKINTRRWRQSTKWQLYWQWHCLHLFLSFLIWQLNWKSQEKYLQIFLKYVFFHSPWWNENKSGRTTLALWFTVPFLSGVETNKPKTGRNRYIGSTWTEGKDRKSQFLRNRPWWHWQGHWHMIEHRAYGRAPS